MQRLVRSSHAVHALAALGREQRHDLVAHLEVAHVGADRLDHSPALVAEHRRRVARRVDARRRVQVGVADAARHQAHEHLARARLGQVDVVDDQWLPELLKHGGADLHVGESSSCWPRT